MAASDCTSDVTLSRTVETLVSVGARSALIGTRIAPTPVQNDSACGVASSEGML